MILLESITIFTKDEEKKIELHQGDLTDLSPEEAVDILVVSAFPNDYTPTPTSLIGALYKKGISVEQLANSKAIDLRENFSCWLSREIKSTEPGIQFNRILCFEPRFRGRPPEVVGDIFRSLAPILGDIQKSSNVAMPLVAAGDQGSNVSEILPPLLDAAIHWLEKGLPIKCLKIVIYSTPKEEAKEIFIKKVKKDFQTTPIQKDYQKFEYDVFISYAREDSHAMSTILKELQDKRPALKVFLDRKDIKIGAAWQPEIFESLDRCKKVLVLFSPSYLKSKVCKEEFNIAWVRSRESEEDIIFPIYWYSAQLPTYMKYRSYIDCREGDKTKLKEACSILISDLEENNSCLHR